MSDPAPAPAPDPAAPAPAGPDPAAPAPEIDYKAELEKAQKESRKWEDRAKQNSAAKTELEKLREASMSDQEKAVEAARAEARAAMLKEFGGNLVDAEIKVAAAGRLDDAQLEALLGVVDRSALLEEDGTVKADAVKAFVDRLAPAPAESARPLLPDLGQGARGGPPALNSTQLQKDLEKALGI